MNRLAELYVRMAALTLITFIMVLLSFSPCRGDENLIGFTENQVNDIVVVVEEHRILQEQAGYYQHANKELERQSELLKQNIELQKQQIGLMEDQIKKKDQLIELDRAECDKRVEEAKPTFAHNAGIFGLGSLAGVIVTVVAILLL